MAKCYDIYFDPAELEVDHNGNVTNLEVLRTVEFDHGKARCINVHITDPIEETLKMFHLGYGDDTFGQATDRFYAWLEKNLEWAESSPETYWHPAEYVCIGVSGYVDELPRYHRLSRTWRL